MYKVVCYYDDFLFGQMSYVVKTNLSLEDAKLLVESYSKSSDIYRVEEVK